MPLNVPTLTLADNANGTGAVATIAGSTGGTTNTVYAAAWNGGFVPAAYASFGSRVGDGTVALALSNGYHWSYVLSTLAGESAISLVKGIRATSGLAAIFDQCMDAIVAKIQSLTLPSPWLAANVKRYKVPFNRNMLTDSVAAGIFVAPANERIAGAMNDADDFGLGIGVTVARKGNQDLTANLSAELLCREQIQNALLPSRGQPALAGVDDVYDVQIEPGPVIDPGAFLAQYDIGGFTARCINRRNREFT